LYHVSQKTAPFNFCNNFAKLSYILIILANICLNKFSTKSIFHILYKSRKQRISLSYSSTARQYNVCTQSSSCFVRICQTSS